MVHGEGLKPRDDRERTGRLEKALMVVSAAVTLSLFAYVAWQAVVTPGEVPPVARVAGVTPDAATGSVHVDVEVENPGGVGYEVVDVEVACAGETATLQFTMVPAGGVRSGIAMCPPDTEDPRVRVVSWVPA